MSRTLLYPMTVSAKVVPALVGVPTLSSQPFSWGAILEAGVHVHWALPDALTKARMVPDAAKQGAVFPAVPDLWLVIRFNPATAKLNARRPWRAWVVDSVAGTAVALADWKAPVREAGKIHTFAGLLPDASGMGYGSGGFLQSSPDDAQNPDVFSPMMASYYPATRRRFGLYDDVKDLPNNGLVSYLVLGWHSSDNFDPVATAGSTHSVLDGWKAVATSLGTARDLRPAIDLGLSTQAPAAPTGPAVRLPSNIVAQGNTPLAGNLQTGINWKTPIQIRAGVALSADRLQVAQRMVARAGSVDKSKAMLQNMQLAFPSVSGGISKYIPPTWKFAQATVYHGAVVSVPLGGQVAPPKPLTNADVTLWPNVQRAMADIASASSGDDRTVNAAEMLFANMQGQMSSTGGVLDMPAATHAATFQSVPGAPRTYLRIDVAPGAAPPTPTVLFSLQSTAEMASRNISGYWPGLEDAGMYRQPQGKGVFQRNPNIPSKFPPATPKPVEPSDADKVAFRKAVRDAFVAASAALQAQGKSPDDHLLYVFDSRANARSLHLGQTTKQTGSDTAGWWVDVSLDADLDELLRTTPGARVSMPSADNIYELPGPRWYRPWSPQLRVQGLGRSYKFGFDGRFTDTGSVQVRRSGDTLVSLRASSLAPVYGSTLVDNEAALNRPGIPGDVVALARETMLMDPASAVAMSGTAGGQTALRAAINGTLFSRSASFDGTATRKSAEWTGQQPSPLAVSLWNDPTDPLFADTSCTFTALDPLSFELPESEVELRAVKSGAVPTGATVTLTERTQLTLTVASTLQSVMVTNVTIDNLGHKVKLPNGKGIQKTIETLDVMSAALPQCDAQLLAAGLRSRAGTLKLQRMSVVDMYGFRREYNAPVPGSGDMSTPVTTPLAPRYPFWSRFGMRLQSAADPNAEATPQSGPVCGMLVPDFLEHTLEVFDADGNALGQFETDPPLVGLTAANNSQPQRPLLSVSYKPHPWIPQSTDPFGGIANATLRQLVMSVAAQAYTVPAGVVDWAESGLSAMLRVIDTIRTTFDPTSKPNSHRVDLIGTPILVMVARLDFRGTDTVQDALIGQNAAPAIAAAPPVPSLQVRLGDAIRPDDGILGIFVPGANPADGRFAPVSAKAAPSALVSAFNPDIHASSGTKAAVHPFVTGKDRTSGQGVVASAESVVTLPVNGSVNVVLLADPGLALYATAGSLPRKKIQVPSQFTDEALKRLSPSFYAGPVLAADEGGSETLMLPPPEVQGYTAAFHHLDPDTPANSQSELPTWGLSPMRAMPPLGELPNSRVKITEGWIQLTKSGS